MFSEFSFSLSFPPQLRLKAPSLLASLLRSEMLWKVVLVSLICRLSDVLLPRQLLPDTLVANAALLLHPFSFLHFPPCKELVYTVTFRPGTKRFTFVMTGSRYTSLLLSLHTRKMKFFSLGDIFEVILLC